jgi:Na+/H+ antiporter NhaD/arsenite permease-like protein
MASPFFSGFFVSVLSVKLTTLDFLMMVMTTSVSGVVSVIVVVAALVNELEQHVEAMRKKRGGPSDFIKEFVHSLPIVVVVILLFFFSDHRRRLRRAVE